MSEATKRVTITVTEHGRPIARLTATAPDVDRRAALIEAGIVRPA